MTAGTGTEEPGERAPRPATLCVHGAGGERDPGAPLVTPIDRSSAWPLGDEAYALRSQGRADRARCYARETNPSVEALEARLRTLEGAQRALVFASGMAAFHALLMGTLERGDNVVFVRQAYGGSLGLVRALLPRLAVELRLVDVDDPDGWAAAVDGSTRLFCCESVSNPLTRVVDLPRVVELVRARSGGRGLVAVDATLATPIGQRPLEHGADLVWHSATKGLGGHSDVIGGVVAGTDATLLELWRWRTRAGGCMDPAAAYLVERGSKTLALRVAAQSANALQVARFLAGHPRVTAVHHCGLQGHPDHDLAARLLDHAGGLFSFVVAGGDDAARTFLRRLRLFVEAPSLGGVESLVSRPRDLSHAALAEEELAAFGIEPGLVRLALGIEDPADLLADVEQALR